MIRIDAVWLAVAAIDMRACTDTALARVVAVFGATRPHHVHEQACQSDPTASRRVNCSILSVVTNNYRKYGTIPAMATGPQVARMLKAGSARSRELVAAGMTRSEISRRVAAGELIRLARGLYALPNYQSGEHRALVEVAKRAPKVVFCLLTALRFHDLTTQIPHEVWIAIGNKDHPPRMAYPPLRTLRFAPAALEAGVRTHRVDGAPIRVTSVAKTVADCFKFRNKVGLDVALEALREARRGRRATVDELWQCARVDRVVNVMRPYLEALS